MSSNFCRASLTKSMGHKSRAEYFNFSWAQSPKFRNGDGSIAIAAIGHFFWGTSISCNERLPGCWPMLNMLNCRPCELALATGVSSMGGYWTRTSVGWKPSEMWYEHAWINNSKRIIDKHQWNTQQPWLGRTLIPSAYVDHFLREAWLFHT